MGQPQGIMDNTKERRKRRRYMPAQLPDFLGIGTQKGGTTTLYKMLKGHSGVYIPSIKEIHYFSLYTDKGIEWYKKHFKDARVEQKKGEITPFYLFHKKAAKRIKNILPNVKIIVLLRNPIERTVSHINHAQQRGFEKLEINEAIKAEKERMKSGNEYSYQKHSYISRSKYLGQLDRYESIFPRKNIKIIKSEDLFNNPTEIWKGIQKFLELEVEPLKEKILHENKRKNNQDKLSPTIREELKEELEETAKGIKLRYGIEWK